MKKTVTVNLNGSLFTIDEDAFLMLSDYLDNVRAYFKTQEGGKEIATDIEIRIAELFNEKKTQGFDVITIEMTQEIICRIGSPEQMQSNGNEDGSNASATPPSFTQTAQPGKRKLYRNNDNKVLGGVISGLATYVGMNVTVARILALVCLVCFSPFMTFVYIILWIFLPLANTTAKKLDMNGIEVTIENIGKSVSEGAKNFGNGVNEFVQSPQTHSTIARIGNGIVNIAGFVMKGVLMAAAGFLSIMVFCLLCAFITELVAMCFVMGGSASSLMALLPQGAVIETFNGAPLIGAFGAAIGVTLMIAIPLGAVAWAIYSAILNFKPMTRWTAASLTIIWALSLFVFVMYFTLGCMRGPVENFTILNIFVP